MTSGSKPPFALPSIATSRSLSRALRAEMKRSRSASTAIGKVPPRSSSFSVLSGSQDAPKEATAIRTGVADECLEELKQSQQSDDSDEEDESPSTAAFQITVTVVSG